MDFRDFVMRWMQKQAVCVTITEEVYVAFCENKALSGVEKDAGVVFPKY